MIEIPGAPTLKKSNVPPIAVPLPQALTVRRGFHIVVGLFYLFVAALLALMGLIFFAVPHSGAVERLLQLGFLLFSVWQMPYWLSAACRALRDCLSGESGLIITSTGLTDTRTGFAAEWKDILSARPVNGRGNEWGVSFKIRDVALLPRSRWLRGFGWLPRDPDEIYCQTFGMSAPSHVARATIFRLVAQAGGSILPPRRTGWLGYSG